MAPFGRTRSLRNRELSPGTLPSLVRAALAAQAREDALVERVGGAWTPISSQRLLGRIEAVALELRRRYEPGDRIALIAGNSVDWLVVNFGILFARCVSVPIYPNQTIAYIRDILRDCGASVVFSDASAAERLGKENVGVPIVRLEGAGASVLRPRRANGASSRAILDDRKTQPSDLAVLAYTSGTTGRPKGVMLSHANLVRNALDTFAYAFAGVRPGDPVISVLPFSHVYEHMLVYGYLNAGTPVYIVHDAGELLTDLRTVRPVVMATVPRILEAILTKIVAQARRSGRVKAALVRWALETGREYARARYCRAGVPFALRALHAAARSLVLREISPEVGLDRLKFCACGSAPLHLDTLLMLKGAGINVVEGYGLTECSPLVTVNVPGRERLGTVGRPIPNVEIRISSEGEVLVRGPNVMLGYYKDAEATASTLGADGWLRTGDIGAIDAEGYLRITDRKKDLIKTSGGEFVAPAAIESAILRSPFIREAMVVGDGRAHLVALVVPEWNSMRGEGDVRRFLAREVSRQTADLSPSERIGRVAVVPHEFSVEAGELSPTMKIKRRVVEAKYRALIDEADPALRTTSTGT